ncbi:hypothetical protein SAMN05421809_2913 [Natronorubrum daqingense]|uniref:Uncharacterized protein n=1 Tax=Natronorubrum daqingense TaxID=588898 RepID=A0A1N7EZX8_9EURY|nr:hypothetical protein SAMN05421809_2913 [Natronorubrum daqingense]
MSYPRYTLTHGSTFDVPQIVDRSSDTELPRLTSNPIYTADRRGEILISFGSTPKPSGVHNPFGPERSMLMERVERPIDHIFFCIPSELPYTLKGVGSKLAGSRIRRAITIQSERPGTYKGTGSSSQSTSTQQINGRYPHTTHPLDEPAGSVQVDGVSTSVPGNGQRGRSGVRHVVRITIGWWVHT